MIALFFCRNDLRIEYLMLLHIFMLTLEKFEVLEVCSIVRKNFI